MYFDEVHHARTAFELLAQREPYEWTHPHLAKEVMALGILAFGEDRIVGTEDVSLSGATAFTIMSDGARIFAEPDGSIFVRGRDGASGRLTAALGPPRALAVSDMRL